MDIIDQTDTITWTVVAMKACGRLWSEYRSVYMHILLFEKLVQINFLKYLFSQKRYFGQNTESELNYSVKRDPYLSVVPEV